jgi:hypothetical protein
LKRRQGALPKNAARASVALAGQRFAHSMASVQYAVHRTFPGSPASTVHLKISPLALRSTSRIAFSRLISEAFAPGHFNVYYSTFPAAFFNPLPPLFRYASFPARRLNQDTEQDQTHPLSRARIRPRPSYVSSYPPLPPFRTHSTESFISLHHAWPGPEREGF